MTILLSKSASSIHFTAFWSSGRLPWFVKSPACINTSPFGSLNAPAMLWVSDTQTKRVLRMVLVEGILVEGYRVLTIEDSVWCRPMPDMPRESDDLNSLTPASFIPLCQPCGIIDEHYPKWLAQRELEVRTWIMYWGRMLVRRASDYSRRSLPRILQHSPRSLVWNWLS